MPPDWVQRLIDAIPVIQVVLWAFTLLIVTIVFKMNSAFIKILQLRRVPESERTENHYSRLEYLEGEMHKWIFYGKWVGLLALLSLVGTVGFALLFPV